MSKLAYQLSAWGSLAAAVSLGVAVEVGQGQQQRNNRQAPKRPGAPAPMAPQPAAPAPGAQAAPVGPDGKTDVMRELEKLYQQDGRDMPEMSLEAFPSHAPGMPQELPPTPNGGATAGTPNANPGGRATPTNPGPATGPQLVAQPAARVNPAAGVDPRSNANGAASQTPYATNGAAANNSAGRPASAPSAAPAKPEPKVGPVAGFFKKLIPGRKSPQSNEPPKPPGDSSPPPAPGIDDAPVFVASPTTRANAPQPAQPAARPAQQSNVAGGGLSVQPLAPAQQPTPAPLLTPQPQPQPVPQPVPSPQSTVVSLPPAPAPSPVEINQPRPAARPAAAPRLSVPPLAAQPLPVNPEAARSNAVAPVTPADRLPAGRPAAGSNGSLAGSAPGSTRISAGPTLQPGATARPRTVGQATQAAPLATAAAQPALRSVTRPAMEPRSNDATATGNGSPAASSLPSLPVAEPSPTGGAIAAAPEANRAGDSAVVANPGASAAGGIDDFPDPFSEGSEREADQSSPYTGIALEDARGPAASAAPTVTAGPTRAAQSSAAPTPVIVAQPKNAKSSATKGAAPPTAAPAPTSPAAQPIVRQPAALPAERVAAIPAPLPAPLPTPAPAPIRTRQSDWKPSKAATGNPSSGADSADASPASSDSASVLSSPSASPSRSKDTASAAEPELLDLEPVPTPAVSPRGSAAAAPGATRLPTLNEQTRPLTQPAQKDEPAAAKSPAPAAAPKAPTPATSAAKAPQAVGNVLVIPTPAAATGVKAGKPAATGSKLDEDADEDWDELDADEEEVVPNQPAAQRSLPKPNANSAVVDRPAAPLTVDQQVDAPTGSTAATPPTPAPVVPKASESPAKRLPAPISDDELLELTDDLTLPGVVPTPRETKPAVTQQSSRASDQGEVTQLLEPIDQEVLPLESLPAGGSRSGLAQGRDTGSQVAMAPLPVVETAAPIGSRSAMNVASAPAAQPAVSESGPLSEVAVTETSRSARRDDEESLELGDDDLFGGSSSASDPQSPAALPTTPAAGPASTETGSLTSTSDVPSATGADKNDSNTSAANATEKDNSVQGLAPLPTTTIVVTEAETARSPRLSVESLREPADQATLPLEDAGTTQGQQVVGQPTPARAEPRDAVVVNSLPPLATEEQAADPAAGSLIDPRMSNILKRSNVRGLKGFCPVALREQRELRDVHPDFAATYRGQRFQLSSREARDKFEREPSRYAPAAFGADVVVLLEDKDVAEGSLEFAAWYKGRLYLFASQANHDRFIANPVPYVTQPGVE